MSAPDPEIEREESAIYIVIIVALSPVIVGATCRGRAAIDAGTALAFLIVALGAIGLATSIRAMRSRLPRARVYRRRQARAPGFASRPRSLSPRSRIFTET